MTQCNRLNEKLSKSQLYKLKSGLKNGTEVTLNVLSNSTGISNDETNFPHKLLLTDTQVSKIRKALNYIDHLLTVISTITRCASISVLFL